MLNRENTVNILIYGIFHAFVDFCCAAIVYSFVGKIDITQLFSLVILYNVIAFGFQTIVGLFCDKTDNSRNYAIIGCGLLASAFFFLKLPYVAVLLAGFGNAFYHIGGGVATLKLSKEKAFLSGLFVAPGAVGLLLGSLLWKIPSFQLIWLSGLMVAGMIVISMLDESENIPAENKFKGNLFILTITAFLILFSIAIRSFIGLSYDFAQKSNLMLFLFVFSLALGKALGGFFSDKFGMFNTSVSALAISLILLYFGTNPYFAILGIMFFNFTMPITLTALANMMPCRKGLAFGLTTLFLFIGALPAIVYKIKISQDILLAVIIGVSILVTATGLKMYEKNYKK